jgi:hypothetical protein
MDRHVKCQIDENKDEEDVAVAFVWMYCGGGEGVRLCMRHTCH